jgi:NAD-dependent SIR2 family protein deacetylase
MEKGRLVKHWVQQNHDGLAQKSGFPLGKLNEIHGSWFDKKNSVVLMDDSLNPKNYKLLEEWEEKVDVCLAIGTSLCGMRSDGIAKNACVRGGLVVINLQQTPYDEVCQLRLYGNLQTIIEKLGKVLGIKITKRICISNPYEWNK